MVLEEIETYISRRQNKVMQYIVTQPIIDLFLEAERSPGSRLPKRWWEQEGCFSRVYRRWVRGGGKLRSIEMRKTSKAEGIMQHI